MRKPKIKSPETLYDLLVRSGRETRLVNFISLYRTITFPLLVYLALTQQFHLFKWFLAVSFFTDAIDGYLARKYKVTSILGARLDSIGDDLTVLAGIFAMIIYRPEFLLEQLPLILILGVFFIIQLSFALYRYHKMSSFHTYQAKLAAVFQGLFLCSVFFFPQPSYWLFYLTIGITASQIIEEIILVALLPQWQANVRGIYWVLRAQRKLISPK